MTDNENVGEKEVTTDQTGANQPEMFTKERVNELMRRRVERSHQSFFNRYGVKDLKELEYENLIKYYNDNLLTEPIRDNEGYLHSFKEGGLYFYNPCYSLEVGSVDSSGHGIHFEWCTESIDRIHLFADVSMHRVSFPLK